MLKFIAHLKTMKWVLYLVLAVGVGVIFLVLRHLFYGPKPAPSNAVLPDVPQALQQKVEQAQEDALQAKAEAKATSDADKAKLEEISKIADGAERRKQLAEMLQNL